MRLGIPLRAFMRLGASGALAGWLQGCGSPSGPGESDPIDPGSTSAMPGDTTIAGSSGTSSGEPMPASDDTAASTSVVPLDESTSDTGESSSTGTPLVLPTPCDEVASVSVYEPNFEPNDAPELATDLCTIDVVGSWHVTAHIGGDDVVDHFVFRSAGDSGVVPLLLDACFDVALDLELHQFNDGDLLFLWSGSSTAPECEEVPPALPAGKDYLLVVSVPRDMVVAAGTVYGW